MHKVLITTAPFSEYDKRTLEILKRPDIEFVINPYGRKLVEDELIQLVRDVDIIIAGTERYSTKVIDSANKLKLISRVGIGLDGIDLNYVKSKNIRVAYTPDAPAPAVAELTISLMLNLLRSVHVSNSELHSGMWKRIFGRRIEKCMIGILGFGRIGSKVAKILEAFGAGEILANDIIPEKIPQNGIVRFAEKEEIIENCDVITIHLPLTKKTSNLISYREISRMKKDAILINTARGGIVNENDLARALQSKKLTGAAIDTFVQEPYSGELTEEPNCLLTAHMGSMSHDCRSQMELESVQEVIRFIDGVDLFSEVPESEYEVQKYF